MRNAFKKCRNLTEENKKKEIKINQLEDSLKVSDVVFRGIIGNKYFQEKNKLLNRFHIYSWKKSIPILQKSAHSISTVNLSSTEKDSFIETLESRLSTFKEKSTNSEQQVDQISEKPSVSNELMKKEDANGDCDNNVDDCDGEASGDDSDAEAESSTSDEESEASEAIDDREEEKVVEEEDMNTFQEKKDVSLSPREKIVDSMSTAEKVKIWLPQAQTTGRDIQISIDESQKVALLAKLNEIDSCDKAIIEATENRQSSASVLEPNNNDNQVERKMNLMEELFGEKAIIPRRKDTYSIGSRPLKTSLRTSPSASGPTKSVKFVED